jgi:hypothetical protein
MARADVAEAVDDALAIENPIGGDEVVDERVQSRFSQRSGHQKRNHGKARQKVRPLKILDGIVTSCAPQWARYFFTRSTTGVGVP